MRIPTATALFLASTALVGTAGAAFIITRRDGSVVASKNSSSGGFANTKLSMSTPESPAAVILSEVGSNDVVVFSKTYCPFCTSTKSLFEGIQGVEARVIELDTRDDGADIQGALLDKTGQRTVPSVFIKGEHIGGNDATQALYKSGELLKKLGIE